MSKIGLICAMDSEIYLITDAMKSMKRYKVLDVWIYEGLIGEHEVVLAKSGIGKVNAAFAATILIREFDCDLLINTGIAGGIAPLETRDLVIASGLQYHDFDLVTFGYEINQVPNMPKVFRPNINSIVMIKTVLNRLGIPYKDSMVYTGDQFIDKMDQIPTITEGAVEMEGAAVAQIATKAGKDFIVIRYISDIIGSENHLEDFHKFEEEMANMSAKITVSLISNLV